MLLFPPVQAVTIIVDGHPVAAYARPFVQGGRAFAPIRPYVIALADRVRFEGDVLVIARRGRVVRVLLPSASVSLASAYVAVAPLMRALGEQVWYDARRRAVEIATPPERAVGSAPPFNPNTPSIAPRSVFTPMPIPTLRPVWSGSPEPRRTPIPITETLPPVGGRAG